MKQTDDVVDRNAATLKNIVDQDVDFDEEEAYFELCQIISMAQQTGNYAKFQSDLNLWKKHYPIESFSDKYKSKIKYMLSEEFLSSVLRDYLAFEQYSKMDPSKQLDRLRRILNKAEHHKDAKRLDADLEALYKDYPLKYLQEKFPHIVARLTSKSYREKILQKFDSDEAYREFTDLIYGSKDFSSFEQFRDALKPLQEKYPLPDFTPKYREKLEPLLREDSLKHIFEDNNELAVIDIDDLDAGTVISLEDERTPLPQASGIFNQKTAYFELLEIMKNPNNVDGVFNWAYTYMRYIGRFDDYHKGLVLSTLLPYYKIPKQKDYSIPHMNSKSKDYLSFVEYNSIEEIKKDAVLQFMAIISTSGALSNDDIERLQIIHDNSKKAEIVDIVSNSLDIFMENTNKAVELTFADPTYFQPKKQDEDTDGGMAKAMDTDVDNSADREVEIDDTNNSNSEIITSDETKNETIVADEDTKSEDDVIPSPDETPVAPASFFFDVDEASIKSVSSDGFTFDNNVEDVFDTDKQIPSDKLFSDGTIRQDFGTFSKPNDDFLEIEF